MPVSSYQLQEMVERVARNAKRQPSIEPPSPEGPARSGCDREGKLHQQIIDWCDRQWPRWKYVHSRFGVKSTLDEGVCDFAIAAPGGRTFYIECKTKDGKLDPAQRDWIAEMNRLGHNVHTVRSMDEFLNLTRPHAGGQPGNLGRGAELKTEEAQ